MAHSLIITTSYPQGEAGKEAAGGFVESFCESLAEKESVSVMAPGIQRGVGTRDNIKVWTYWSPNEALSTLSLSNPLHILKLMRIFISAHLTLRAIAAEKQSPITSILALWVFPSGLWAWYLSKKLGCPYSTWALGSDIWSLAKLPILKNLMQYIIRHAHKSYSDGFQLKTDVEALANRETDFLASTRKLQRIENRAERDQAHGLVLGFLGRWHYNKGIDTLLDCLENHINDAAWGKIRTMRIYGGGPLEGLVREKVTLLIEKHGRPIELGGYLGRKEVEAFMADIDYLLVPSRIESIPVIISDAANSHCPVIATPVGDLPQIMSEFPIGLCSEKNTASSYGKTVCNIINKHQSINFSNKGFFELFSIEKSTDRYSNDCEIIPKASTTEKKSDYKLLQLMPEAYTSFFHSLRWSSILKKGFNAQHYLLLENGKPSHTLTLFRKSIFCLAYIDFPVGVIGNRSYPDLMAIDMLLKENAINVDALRFTGFQPCTQIGSRTISGLPRTHIKKMDAGIIFSLPKVRKSLAPANKFNITIKEEQDTQVAEKIYATYMETLRIRDGSSRYTPEYFAGLIEAGISCNNLYVLTAYVDESYAGFFVLCVEGEDAYYLHGGYNRQFNRYRISDKLMEEALNIAIKQGASRLDMGESPPDNQGLIDFKEKWDGTTETCYSTEYRIHPLKCQIMNLASAILKHLPN